MPGQCAKKQAPAQYIRYTPSEQGVGFAGGAKQRIIRMVETQSDPMEPPRFRTNKKIPRGPPSPPAPVMHSPTRKLTQKEQLEWRIPPAISNWKNPKGNIYKKKEIMLKLHIVHKLLYCRICLRGQNDKNLAIFGHIRKLRTSKRTKRGVKIVVRNKNCREK
jgi:hypothetical protein